MLGREGAGYIPRCSVILCPDPDKLIQMVRAQDGGIPCQVLKVVHDDCHEQVEHLNERGKGREKGKWREREQRKEGREKKE